MYSWAVSSAGSERLPYKQDVGGSNPSLPTRYLIRFIKLIKFNTQRTILHMFKDQNYGYLRIINFINLKYFTKPLLLFS